MFRLASLFVLAWYALHAVAQDITIIAPSPNYWWVAQSENLYSWTCGAQYNQGYTNFTVLINNASPTVFPGPLALVAIQWDYDCSVLIEALPSIPAATGYSLYFADVFNQSHIIARSQPFEIKPLGSAYAPQPSGVSSATVTASANGTAGAPTSTSTSTKKSGASASSTAAFGLVATFMALAGAALMM